MLDLRFPIWRLGFHKWGAPIFLSHAINYIMKSDTGMSHTGTLPFLSVVRFNIFLHLGSFNFTLVEKKAQFW